VAREVVVPAPIPVRPIQTWPHPTPTHILILQHTAITATIMRTVRVMATMTAVRTATIQIITHIQILTATPRYHTVTWRIQMPHRGPVDRVVLVSLFFGI
jgi:hypothetical protein